MGPFRRVGSRLGDIVSIVCVLFLLMVSILRPSSGMVRLSLHNTPLHRLGILHRPFFVCRGLGSQRRNSPPRKQPDHSRSRTRTVEMGQTLKQVYGNQGERSPNPSTIITTTPSNSSPSLPPPHGFLLGGLRKLSVDTQVQSRKELWDNRRLRQ